MTIYYKEGDAIKGNLIVGEARKITKPKVIVKTGRHKALKVKLYENAFCRIEKKFRFIK